MKNFQVVKTPMGLAVSYLLARLMMCSRILLFTYSLTCLLAYSLHAGVGTTGAQFLKISPSARASGMANAFSGVADDVFALYSNPAGLSQMENAELAATYLNYFADVKFGFVGYASQIRDLGVFGFGYTYLLVDSIDKRDVDETDLGDFNAKDISLTVAYGRKNVVPSILENVSLGGSIKIISSEIDQTIAYTAALDLAAMYSPVEKLNTALVIQNISPGIKFKEVTDKLPLNLKLGVSYKPIEKLSVGGEIDEYLIDNKLYAALGAEYRAIDKLVVRAGYRFGYNTSSLGSTVGLSAGLGFRIWSVGLDYAFLPFGDLGNTHRVTFLAKF